MNARSLFALALLASTACIPAYAPDYSPKLTVAAEGTGDALGAELFPNGAEDRWYYSALSIYQSAEGTQATAGRTMRMRPAGAQLLFGTQGQRFELAAQVTLEAWLRIDAEGAWYYGAGNRAYPSPLPLLHFPVRAGKRWVAENAELDQRFEAEALGFEELGTPAGVFRALHVRSRLESSGGQVFAEDQWFVPGLGLVRRQGNAPLLGPLWHLRHFQVQGLDAVRARYEVQP